jgi:hypothetical protein
MRGSATFSSRELRLSSQDATLMPEFDSSASVYRICRACDREPIGKLEKTPAHLEVIVLSAFYDCGLDALVRGQ